MLVLWTTVPNTLIYSITLPITKSFNNINASNDLDKAKLFNAYVYISEFILANLNIQVYLLIFE